MSSEEPIYTKPFLKWAGNKFRVIDQVMKAMEWRGWHGARHKYLEPFGGSGAVIANVDDLFEHRTYGEFNPELIDLMRSVTEETDALIEATEALFVPENNHEDAYRKLRTEFNKIGRAHV